MFSLSKVSFQNLRILEFLVLQNFSRIFYLHPHTAWYLERSICKMIMDSWKLKWIILKGTTNQGFREFLSQMFWKWSDLWVGNWNVTIIPWWNSLYGYKIWKIKSNLTSKIALVTENSLFILIQFGRCYQNCQIFHPHTLPEKSI